LAQRTGEVRRALEVKQEPVPAVEVVAEALQRGRRNPKRRARSRPLFVELWPGSLQPLDRRSLLLRQEWPGSGRQVEPGRPPSGVQSLIGKLELVVPADRVMLVERIRRAAFDIELEQLVGGAEAPELPSFPGGSLLLPSWQAAGIDGLVAHAIPPADAAVLRADQNRGGRWLPDT
jgi:hypothetical protein